MRYTTYSETELRSMQVWPEGIYEFEVEKVDELDQHGHPLKDKNGGDMARLKLLCFDGQGRNRFVFTNLFAQGLMAFKLRHFADSIGMLQEYENGILDLTRTVGKKGKAHIIIQNGALKDSVNNTYWPDKNEVKDFIKLSDAQASNAQDNLAHYDNLNDDIPL